MKKGVNFIYYVLGLTLIIGTFLNLKKLHKEIKKNKITPTPINY
ncbi:MAG: hypothetical protein QW474_00090 [Candidatus Aenigmatarchaeota archaeon]